MLKSYCVFGRKALLSAILVLGFLLLAGEPVLSQNNLPRLPQLALVPQAFQASLFYGNGTFYPDGRIWAARSPNNGPRREILVPVLIKNTWVTDPQQPQYPARPIHSFKFKVQYDGDALRAIGVQKVGPLPGDTYSLAKDFQLDWDVATDISYKKSLDASQGNNPSGRRIRITGTSAHPLPPSPPDNASSLEQREFVELLYIRFEVLVSETQSFPSMVPLIITNDTLMYNDMDVRDRQFQLENGYSTPATNEPVPGEYGGLHGINNENLGPDVTEPTRPGVVYVSFADPGKFGFEPQSEVQPVANENATWELVIPMTIEKFQQNPDVATKQIFVFNSVPQSRITNIQVRSDAPWLQFNTEGDKAPCNGPTRDCEIDYMDNGILGGNDPLGMPTDPDPQMRMEIIADPSAVGDQGGSTPYDGAGIYIGYITFSSSTAKITPVRLKVIFIVYRNPIEPLTPANYNNQTPFNFGRGITLTVENSAQSVQRTDLIFGTGVGANLQVDPLFGEEEYATPLGNNFGARWYPQDETGAEVAPNGLADKTGRSNSRDIRDITKNSTHIYHAKFNAGAEDNYPIVISWDVNDFPEGSQLYIRDRDGNFITNMRDATPVPGNPNRRSITITDARVDGFVIEYSPVTVTVFPRMQKGWNLVSLPLRPGNAEYRSVFPSSLEAPRFFSANSYFQEPDGMLRFGIGYFVKYGNILDSTLAGAPVYKVGANTPYQILLREGWNTIGALSCPVKVEDIRFDAASGQQLPRIVSGVYSYRTDRGYEQVSSLEPGVGYWLKIEGDGYLNMETQPGCRQKESAGIIAEREAAIAVSSKLTVRDNDLREANLFIANGVVNVNRFALPPVPPSGLFDVRFTSGRYIDDASQPVVEIRGAQYPVVLTMDNADANYTVIDALSGAVLGTIEKGNNSSVEINNPKTFAVKFLKSGDVTGGAYNLEQNLPNPFNTATEIGFTLPQQEQVTIKLYNMMGQEVATIFNGLRAAGFNSVNFDASELSSGTYTYTITAGSFTATRRMVIVK